MSHPTTPTTQPLQTVSDTQAATAKLPNYMKYGNPFMWAPPEYIKLLIEEVVYSELLAGTRVKREDMKSMITY
ncbi:hypothetical protein FHL15_007113 [Xylaria flabelliformis]|uniref:Uncharacterized protein n=1 Tax=Xylaria flabelliformis TaxID=2512241 RepID=A0A553HVN6_9PEZI|nr:hypothetical protein FHL15_007113 [Xylaria flabelliformis]